MSEERKRDWGKFDELLDAPPHVCELGDGSFRVEKAGIVGVGPTIDEATRDMAEKLSKTLIHGTWQEPGG